MKFPSDAPEAGDDIDMDRVVIDPDYRRRVLADLRRSRLTEQAQASGSPARLSSEASAG